MRKALATLLALGLVAGAFSAPALAGKKKKVVEEFSVTGAPLPLLVEVDPQGGCVNMHVEGLHKATFPFTAPSAGSYSAHIEGFQGDWDIHVTDASGAVIGSSNADQNVSGAPPTEDIIGITLAKGDEVTLHVCNWLGGPSASGNFTFAPK